MTPLRVGVVLVAVFVLVTGLRAEDVRLGWKFKKGQVFKYALKHSEIRTVSVGDQKLETTTTGEYEWEWKVIDVDDGGAATLEHRFTTIKLKTATPPMFEMEYDSSGSNESTDDYKKKAFNFFDQLRFARYRVTLRADGTVAEVYGLDKVINETTAGTGVADFHAVNLHDDTFAFLLQQMLGTLPEKATAVGGKWKTASPAKLPTFGALTGEVETALGKAVKVNDRTAYELTRTGSQKFDIDTKLANLTVRGSLKSTKQMGKVYFDAEAGSVRKGEMQMELAGELKLGDGDNPGVLKITYQHQLELEAK